MELARDELLRLFSLMKLTRALEDRARTLYQQGRIKGTLKTGRGNEATSVGAAGALDHGDIIAPLHRDLGAMLARGITPREVAAQWLARGDSLSRGRDGQLHIGDMRERLVLPMADRPGATLPLAAGAALGAKLRGDRRVTLAFIGDGGTHTGDFHETLNFAAALDLPLVIVIENNGYAAATPTNTHTRLKNMADRAAAYGIPGHVADGNDVLEVHEIARRAIEVARSGRGPSLIEAKTFRVGGHTEADSANYVPIETMEEWRKRDPIDRFTRYLVNTGAITAEEITAIDDETQATIDDALDHAEHGPAPDLTTISVDVFAPDDATPLGPQLVPSSIVGQMEGTR